MSLENNKKFNRVVLDSNNDRTVEAWNINPLPLLRRLFSPTITNEEVQALLPKLNGALPPGMAPLGSLTEDPKAFLDYIRQLGPNKAAKLFDNAAQRVKLDPNSPKLDVNGNVLKDSAGNPLLYDASDVVKQIPNSLSGGFLQNLPSWRALTESLWTTFHVDLRNFSDRPIEGLVMKNVTTGNLQNFPMTFSQYIDALSNNGQSLKAMGVSVYSQADFESSLTKVGNQMLTAYPHIEALKQKIANTITAAIAGGTAALGLAMANGANNPYSNNPQAVDQSQQAMNRNQVPGNDPAQAYLNGANGYTMPTNQSSPMGQSGFGNLSPSANPKPVSPLVTDDLSNWNKYVGSSNGNHVKTAQVASNPYPNAEQLANYLLEVLGPSQGTDPSKIQEVMQNLERMYQSSAQILNQIPSQQPQSLGVNSQ